MQGHLEELKRGGRPMTKNEIKLNILNKGIDELLMKYENKVEQRKVKIIFNETFKDDRMLELNNQAELIYLINSDIREELIDTKA